MTERQDQSNLELPQSVADAVARIELAEREIAKWEVVIALAQKYIDNMAEKALAVDQPDLSEPKRQDSETEDFERICAIADSVGNLVISGKFPMLYQNSARVGEAETTRYKREAGQKFKPQKDEIIDKTDLFYVTGSHPGTDHGFRGVPGDVTIKYRTLRDGNCLLMMTECTGSGERHFWEACGSELPNSLKDLSFEEYMKQKESLPDDQRSLLKRARYEYFMRTFQETDRGIGASVLFRMVMGKESACQLIEMCIKDPALVNTFLERLTIINPKATMLVPPTRRIILGAGQSMPGRTRQGNEGTPIVRAGYRGKWGHKYAYEFAGFYAGRYYLVDASGITLNNIDDTGKEIEPQISVGVGDVRIDI